MPHTAGVAGGGQKGLYGKPITEKGTMARQALVDMEGNTGANTREKSCQQSAAGHWHRVGLDEETTNTRDERRHHLQPCEGGSVQPGKKVEKIQHTK